MSEVFSYAPLRLPYLVELALLLGALLAAVNLPATIAEGHEEPRSIRVALGGAVRTQFLLATWTSSLAWSAAALFLTFMPAYVARISGSNSVLLQGTVSGGLLIVSGIAQLLMRGRDYKADEAYGLLLTGGGAGLLMLAYLIWWPALFAAVAAAGFGLGFSFRGGMRHVNAIADERQRVSVVSFLYVGIYLAEGTSVLAVGAIVATGGSVPAVLTGMGTITVSCFATAMTAAHARIRGGRPVPANSSRSQLRDTVPDVPDRRSRSAPVSDASADGRIV